MESNDELSRRLARMVEGHDEMIRELKANTLELKDMNKTAFAMLGGQAQEIRELKTMSKRQERFAEDHERTLRLHYRLIRDSRERGR